MPILKYINLHKLRQAILVMVILLCLNFRFAWGQDENLVRPLVEASDLKKLDKADQFSKEAEDLTEEANRINMQALSLQDSKKSGQLENKAMEKLVEASTFYAKSNELKFTIYKKHLENYWEKNPGAESTHLNEKLLEEQAGDKYLQAASYRLDAKKMETGNAKVEKLTGANNLESEAIHNILTSLVSCYNLQSAETTGPGSEKLQAEVLPPGAHPNDRDISGEVSTPANLVIDQQMIDMYNRYVREGDYNDTLLSTGRMAAATSFERDRMLELWYAYVYGRSGEEPDILLPGPESENLAMALPDNRISQDEGREIGIITDENQHQLIPADEEVIYRVQIAAQRTELTQRALSKMYYGKHKVEMVNENGWFKYSVGDFMTYKDASSFRKSSGISSAFVVAYRKGKNPGAAPVMALTDTSLSVSPSGVNMMPGGLVFRIQIAASHVPFTIAQLQRIYDGTYPVERVEENGWYKYQLLGVRLYSDAVRIKKDVSANGAFIVAYRNGILEDLAVSVNGNRELEKKTMTSGRKGNIRETEFHVQLSASKITLSPEEITKLYSGTEKVTVILEEGWYKYRLKAGDSYDTARSLLKKCGINQAFIVSYRRAAKVPLYDALRDSR